MAILHGKQGLLCDKKLYCVYVSMSEAVQCQKRETNDPTLNQSAQCIGVAFV